MSKLNIGVGDEFPLDESPVRAHRHGRHRHHRHHRHPHSHHPHRRHLVPWPLLMVVAAVAAAFGAGKIPPLAGHPVLAAVGVVVLLMMLAHAFAHLRWRRKGA